MGVSSGFIVTSFVWLLLVYAAVNHVRKNVDTRLTSLMESYQPMFLEEYGVELGYGRFSLSPKGGWFPLPCIYLRRPRRRVDEEAPVGGDCQDLGRFPPIYLTRLIPGEIHLDEKEYDPASMKVDAETWSLLQSTHQKMIQWHPIMKFVVILPLLGFYVGCYWLGGHNPFGGSIGLVIWGGAHMAGKVCEYVVDMRNLKVYDEVTKVVNKALQKDEKNLAVEFHTSEVSGREGKHGRRYQFVQRDRSLTKELV